MQFFPSFFVLTRLRRRFNRQTHLRFLFLLRLLPFPLRSASLGVEASVAARKHREQRALNTAGLASRKKLLLISLPGDSRVAPRFGTPAPAPPLSLPLPPKTI